MVSARIALVALAVVLCGGCASTPARVVASEPASAAATAPWSIVLISDVHVYTSGKVAPAFLALIPRIVELKPRFVIVLGDTTGGNADDKHGLGNVRRWWKAFDRAVAPLREAGITLLPVAGNHDYYRVPHQQGYVEAWSDLETRVAPLPLNGKPPLHYSLDVDGVHLSLLHVVDQGVDSSVLTWLDGDLKAAAGARLRLAFGHVPLFSVMGKTNTRFRDRFGAFLAEHGVAAYFAGHEHLVWDGELKFGDRVLRQVIVGTASATYTFPLSPRSFAENCARATCLFPHGGGKFWLDTGTRQQRHKQTLAVIDIDAFGYQLRHLAVDPATGKLVSFTE